MAPANKSLPPSLNLIVRSILREQVSQIERQEAAFLSGGGREALHDFRVAIRRIRTLLGQCKSYLCSDLLASRSELGWLGQLTGPLRDTDVLLTRFPVYLQVLVPATARGLQPLQRRLLALQENQAAELTRQLRHEKRYLQLKTGLRSGLEKEVSLVNENGEQSEPSQMIARVVGKAFRRLLRQGDGITAKSPDEDLHQLRKSGKKLRYLLEFFGDFYPTQIIHERVVELKCLQDNLGRFQDLSVQMDNLRDFTLEWAETEPVPAATTVALEQLLAELQAQKQTCRKEFGERFQNFRQQNVERGWLQLTSKGQVENGCGNRT